MSTLRERAINISEIRTLLAASGSAVVSGPPGIGKSRLLAEFCEAWSGEVITVMLDGVSSAERCIERVAGALGIGTVASPPIGAALRGRPGLLLALDEAEEAAAVLGELLDRWSAEAPAAKILVASRVRIAPHLPTWSLGPLDEADAIALFLARARAVHPQAPLVADDVREVVAALEGVPLAIELAAARIRLFPPASLVGRLPDVLVDPKRRGRHSSLQSAFQASWDLLAPEDRAALAACTLFQGTFDVQAFEAVTGDSPQRLESLLDASLIGLVEPGQVRLLSSVRSFAAAHLSHTERDSLMPIHTRWALTTGEERLEQSRRSGDWRPTEGVRQDLLAVVARGGPDAVRAALVLAELMELRGPVGDPTATLAEIPLAFAVDVACVRARQHLRQGRYADALATLDEITTFPDDTHSLRWIGHRLATLAMMNRFDEGIPLLARVEALVGRISDQRLLASVHIEEGIFHHRHSDSSSALRALSRAAESLRRAPDRYLEARLETYLGLTLRPVQFERAGDHLRRAVELYRGLSETWEARVTGVLAVQLLDKGDLAGAAQLHLQAATLAARHGDSWFEASNCRYLTMVRVEQRDWEDVERLRERALALHPEPQIRAELLFASGVSALLQGNRLAALERIEEAIDAQIGLGFLVVAATYRIFLAVACWEAAAPERAQQILREVEQETSPLSDAQRLLVSVVWECWAGALSQSTRERLQKPGWYGRLLLVALESGIAVALDGAWFETGPGQRISLSRRVVLQRILSMLARAGPGQWTPRALVIAAGWPQEKMAGASADTRLHVAISTLRKLGLGEHLRTGEIGGDLAYGLGDKVRVES